MYSYDSKCCKMFAFSQIWIPERCQLNQILSHSPFATPDGNTNRFESHAIIPVVHLSSVPALVMDKTPGEPPFLALWGPDILVTVQSFTVRSLFSLNSLSFPLFLKKKEFPVLSNLISYMSCRQHVTFSHKNLFSADWPCFGNNSIFISVYSQVDGWIESFHWCSKNNLLH